MKIVGFQSGHDPSYCILEDGIPIVHEELERFTREKEPPGWQVSRRNDASVGNGPLSSSHTRVQDPAYCLNVGHVSTVGVSCSTISPPLALSRQSGGSRCTAAGEGDAFSLKTSPFAVLT